MSWRQEVGTCCVDTGHGTGRAASRIVIQDCLETAFLQSQVSRSRSPGRREELFPALLSRL